MTYEDITFDVEATNLLDDSSIDYTASPYKIKDDFSVHCIVVEEHKSNKIIAFYDGPTYELDGRTYEEEVNGRVYKLDDYRAIQHEHRPLNEFREYIKTTKIRKVIAHNGINYDLMVTKLCMGMDYSVVPDQWDGKDILFEDTLVLSKCANPDRFGGHSLDNLGKKVGLNKISFRKNIRQDERFLDFAADMLYYCIRDVLVNTRVYKWVLEELQGWDWQEAINTEKQVAEIITRQQHRGFKFDTKLAEKNVIELDKLMEERRDRVTPLLPRKKATKKFMGDFTPPARQVKKDSSPTSYLLKFAEKVGGSIVLGDQGEVESFIYKDKEFPVPLPQDPLETEQDANIDDTTHIKDWLVGLGWKPSEYKESDLSYKQVKGIGKIKRNYEEFEKAVERYVDQTLACSFKIDRLDFLGTSSTKLKDFLLKKDIRKPVRVYTNPNFTVGQEKELCPNLEQFSTQFPNVKDVVEYMTYKHRRNSILGGGLEWEHEEDAEKGYMAYLREDGRIPTPADTCGAACVVADTLLVTDKGTVPILDVKKGDLVLTHNGVYGKVVDRIDNGIKPVAEITFESGNSITSTLNHPYLTPKGWTTLEELAEGDEVFFYAKEEQWAKVAGFSNYYVSSWGRVFNLQGQFIKLKPRVALWSRSEIELVSDSGVKKSWGLGPLVLTAFVGPKFTDKECCHKDGNPTNNYIDNLYWGTSSDNSRDAKVHGRALKSARGSARLTQSQVDEIRKYYTGNGHTTENDIKLAKQYRVSREHIRDIRLNKRWKEGNTHNLYKEEFKLTKVLTITSKGQKPTFDITVEDHHSYIANGVVCHNTTRFKHRVTVNVPRPSSLYGKPMRSLFGVDSNFYQVGYDFDSLEARIEAHYCNRWEKGKEKPYCLSLLQAKPNDVHTKTAEKIAAIIKKDFGRTPAKSVKYSCTYGATAPKVAKTIGTDIKTGTKVFNAFWEAALPLKRLKDKLKTYWETTGERKYVLGIDGRKIPTRSAHAILNSLFQSAGVICAKKAMIIHDKSLKEKGYAVDFFKDDWKNMKGTAQQLIAYHDEAQLEVSKDLVEFRIFETELEAEQFKGLEESQSDRIWSDIGKARKGYFVAYCEVGELAAKAVKMAGEYYKLNIELTAGYMLGRNWAECH